MAIRFLFPLALVLTAMLASGCSRHHHHAQTPGNPQVVVVKDAPSRPGPPPHAPAHGYRAKHSDGTKLRYDKGLGVYVVVGHDDTWFLDDLYIRWSGDHWMASVRLDGGWSEYSAEKVPTRLFDKKSKQQHKHKQKHKNKH